MTCVAWFRTILGFLVAPIAPGVLAVVLAALVRPGVDPLALAKLGQAAWVIELSALLGYPIAIALGVPLYILFRWKGWNGLLVYVAAGAFLGLIVYLASVLADGLSQLAERFSNTAPSYLPAGVICGAVAGTTFWLIARPDRARL
jgi:hypothetical protein